MKNPLAVFALGLALPWAAVSAADFDAAAATNHVGLDLLRRLGPAAPGDNLILSPYSIESALALVYAGADGDTRTEMARVLRFGSEDEPIKDAFQALRTSLDHISQQSKIAAGRQNKAGGHLDAIEWNAANRIFGQQGYAFRESFLALMKDGYAAPFEPLNFSRDPEGARGTINAWVEEQTRQKIRNLIPQGALDSDIRLVLVNALYLKAPWQKTFEKSDTRPAPFHFRGGETRDVPTMHRTGFMGHAAEDGLTVVGLDYLGGELQCLILLPDTGRTPDDLLGTLTPQHFKRWSGLGRSPPGKSVALALPKFKVEGGTVPLGKALRALGMKSAFDEPRGSANFERIAPRKADDYLAVSEVFHRTFVALDEDGTEAAAATAVTMRTLSAAMPPPMPLEVRVDRPFLFAIQHRASGTCLFLGRISDPR
jgi:serpin B